MDLTKDTVVHGVEIELNILDPQQMPAPQNIAPPLSPSFPLSRQSATPPSLDSMHKYEKPPFIYKGSLDESVLITRLRLSTRRPLSVHGLPGKDEHRPEPSNQQVLS